MKKKKKHVSIIATTERPTCYLGLEDTRHKAALSVGFSCLLFKKIVSHSAVESMDFFSVYVHLYSVRDVSFIYVVGCVVAVVNSC